MHGNVFKDRSRNFATFKMELFATIDYGRVYNQYTIVFACCCSNLIIFTGKIKIGWKWPCLEGGIRHDFLFCRHVFTFFQKRQLLCSTICFISKINYKNENWYHYRFHLPVFYWHKQPFNTYILKDVVNKMQEKQLWRSYFLKKNKDWNKFILIQLNFNTG